jgi:hypothetical protein
LEQAVENVNAMVEQLYSKSSDWLGKPRRKEAGKVLKFSV